MPWPFPTMQNLPLPFTIVFYLLISIVTVFLILSTAHCVCRHLLLDWRNRWSRPGSTLPFHEIPSEPRLPPPRPPRPDSLELVMLTPPPCARSLPPRRQPPSSPLPPTPTTVLSTPVPLSPLPTELNRDSPFLRDDDYQRRHLGHIGIYNAVRQDKVPCSRFEEVA